MNDFPLIGHQPTYWTPINSFLISANWALWGDLLHTVEDTRNPALSDQAFEEDLLHRLEQMKEVTPHGF